MDHGDMRLSEVAEDCLHGDAVDILAATTKSLVAIGAAAALNCHVCLRHLVPTALNSGILAEEVAGALTVAREIRGHASDMTDDLSAALVKRGEVGSNGEEPATECC